MKSTTLALFLLLLPSLAVAQARKVDVQRSERMIGSWLIVCAMDPMTDTQACRMRHKVWLVMPDETRPGMALEVQLRAGQFVPVVAVRELSLNTALHGLLTLTATAQMRLDRAPMVDLPCALDGATVICAPVKGDVVPLAEQLAKAKTVLIRLRAVADLPLPMPDGPLALDLDQTQEALTQYRLAGPAEAHAQPSLIQEFVDTAERLMRGLGVPEREGEPSQQK